MVLFLSTGFSLCARSTRIQWQWGGVCLVEAHYVVYLACRDVFINGKFKGSCLFLCTFCSVLGTRSPFLAPFTSVAIVAVTASCKKAWNCIWNVSLVIKGYKILALEASTWLNVHGHKSIKGS